MPFDKLFYGVKENYSKNSYEDNGVTDDKTLLSLRRQKRLMDEREEKRRLREELRSRALADDRKAFSSSTMKEDKTILSRTSSSKEKRFMTAKNTIFS